MTNRTSGTSGTVAKTTLIFPNWFLSSLFFFSVATLFLAGQLHAEEKIIKSHGLSAYGDLKYPADFKHFDYVNPNAPKGGEFSESAIGSFDSMHLYTIKGTSASFGSIFYEPLMEASNDEPDSLYGLIAETVEYPESRQWVIFNLRKEARFSDGSLLTAEDVVFTYNVLYEKGIPSLKTVFSDFKSVEALDPYTVKFTFHEGASTKTLPSLAAGLPVFSKAHWADKDFAQSTLEPGLGSGPYVLDKLEVGRSVIVRRNPDYWGAHLAINQGRNNFDIIREEYFTDATAGFEAFKAGAVKFRVEGESIKWATGYDFPAANKGWIKREEIPNGDLPTATGFFFNLRKEKFQDIRVREAIGLMFNYEWANETLFYGLYKRLDSFWENTDLEATGPIPDDEAAFLTQYQEHFPEELFSEEAVSPTVSGNRQLNRKKVRKANKLLDAAGWVVENGIRVKDGKELTVNFMIFSDTQERYINPFIENVKKVGIKGSITVVDRSQYLERRGKHDFDILTSRHVTYLTPSIGLRQWFNSQNAMVDSRNFTGIQNPGIDAIIEDVLAAETRDQMAVGVRSLDRALRSLRIWVPRWYNPNHWVAYWDVFDHPENMPPFALGRMDFWWYSEEKAAELKAAGAL